MAKIELKVKMREKIGKVPSKRIRREGNVPAVLYGRGTTPVYLSVEESDLMKTLSTLAGSTALLSLVAEGDGALSGKLVLLKEVQIHPVSQRVLHVDLYEVSMDRKVSIKIPLVLQGKPVGVIAGGVLQQVTRELLVECLPLNIPQKIDVDVSSLGIGRSLHVRDLVFPEGIVSKADADLTIASVVAPISDEELKAMEAAATAPPEVVQPEVIGKEKEAEVPEEEAEAAAPEAKVEEKKPEAPAQKPVPESPPGRQPKADREKK